MPAIGPLEGEGYPITRLGGRVPKDDIPALKHALQLAGTETMAYFLRMPELAGRLGDAQIDDFVKADVLVTSTGALLDVKGQETYLQDTAQISITPQHAHGGCYTYRPVAAEFAKQLEQAATTVGLRLNKLA